MIIQEIKMMICDRQAIDARLRINALYCICMHIVCVYINININVRLDR